MFSHFRHSEKTLPPIEQPLIETPPSPIPFAPPPPQPVSADLSPSFSESFNSFIKTIFSFTKPSNISSCTTPNRRVALMSTNNSSSDVLEAAPTQAPPSSGSSISIGLVAGIAVGVVFVLVGLAAIFICFMRKKKPRASIAPRGEDAYPQRFQGVQSPIVNEQRYNNGKGHYVGSYPHQAQPNPAIVVEMTRGTYSFDELSKATNGFSKDNILGQGGFGQVFKGNLNGVEIAVKKLRQEGSQGDKEFRVEVDIITRVHHKNLVSLIGHCIHEDQRLLVYEFVANRTLDFHLRGNNQVPLSWQNRYKIALGAAKGLAYLHEDCDPKIIHRDIKASNILLDLNFEPKVADFGLAKYQSIDQTHVSTRIMGTFGYIAPEFATSGRLTDKADVYSFGVVILELITGRPPAQSYRDETLVGWARPLLERALEDGEYDELVDPRLGSNYDPYGMARMIECALASVRQTFRRRPTMMQIVQHLQGDITAEDLNAGMTPGHSSSISFSSFNSGHRSSDMQSGIRRFRSGPRYASSEFSDQSSNQNPTVEQLAR